MRTNKRLLVKALLPLLVCAALPAPAHAGDKVDWIVAPYLWLPTTTVDFSTPADVGGGGSSGGAADEFFPDALDELDGAFLGYVEAQGDHWGMFANVLYLGLASDEDFAIAATASDLDATVIDVAAVYSFDDQRFDGFELYAGLRYIDIDYQIDIDPVNPALQSRSVKVSDSYNDFLFGARLRGTISGNWGYALEGDGSTGDSEGTWSASARITYKTGNGAWVAGWRYLDGEIEPGRNGLDVTLNGPIIGYAFRF